MVCIGKLISKTSNSEMLQALEEFALYKVPLADNCPVCGNPLYLEVAGTFSNKGDIAYCKKCGKKWEY